MKANPIPVGWRGQEHKHRRLENTEWPKNITREHTQLGVNEASTGVEAVNELKHRACACEGDRLIK